MTEEQLQRIKDEAKRAAEYASTFIGIKSDNLQSVRSTAILYIEAAFMDGVRFGFRLAKESEPEEIPYGVYKVGGSINKVEVK